MRKLFFVLILPMLLFVGAIGTIVGLVDHVGAQSAEPNGSPTPRLKLAPKLHPRMVSLLKEQADLRKQFFDSEAKLKSESKAEFLKETQELLEKHRAKRAEFSQEKHSAEERAAFYRGQRDEMAALKQRLGVERKELNVELKRKLTELHRDQKEKRVVLEDEIRNTK